MVRNQRERGEGRLGCLVGLVLLAVAVMVAYKMIPIKVKVADFRDTIQDYSRSAGTHSDKAILQGILAKAQQLDLPVTEDNIDINRAAGAISIDVAYTVPVAFPGYIYNWNFHHETDNPIF